RWEFKRAIGSNGWVYVASVSGRDHDDSRDALGEDCRVDTIHFTADRNRFECRRKSDHQFSGIRLRDLEWITPQIRSSVGCRLQSVARRYADLTQGPFALRQCQSEGAVGCWRNVQELRCKWSSLSAGNQGGSKVEARHRRGTFHNDAPCDILLARQDDLSI